MKKIIKHIVKPENGIETAIVSDVDFIAGCSYGKPRSGHPEGKIIYHIKEVLDNIDKWYGDDNERKDLRLIAIIHDSFKYKVNQNKIKVGANHHAIIAKNFAEKYIKDNKVLTVIELHDEAYNAWQKGGRKGDWYGAERRAFNLIAFLISKNCLGLYDKFFKCDNNTGNKSQENYEWFINLIKRDIIVTN